MTQYKLVPVKPTPEMEAVFKRFQMGRCEWNVLLRAAPEPDVEPVAEVRWAADVPNSIIELRLTGNVPPPVGTKLYAAPQPAKQPLTDREVGAIMEELNAYGTRLWDFARAIERAHGITGETE